MGDGEKRKGNSRGARLEAELRANLKKRKEQARARSRAAEDAESGRARKVESGAAGEDSK